MQYKSKENETIFPISEVNITRTEDSNILTQIHIKISGSAFEYDFNDPTEITIIAKVLTGKISANEGFRDCCENYSYGIDLYQQS